MPWLSVAEMAAVFLLPESTVRDAVNELEESRQLFHLQIGANKRVTDRYALRGRGLIELSRSEGRSLSAGWQATESGLLTRLKRLPMTEAFYGLVPGLCQSSLLHDQYLEYPRELDDPRGPDSGFLRGSRLVRFSWNSAGSLHATASFETVTGQILDVGFRWERRQRPIPSLPKVDDLVDAGTTNRTYIEDYARAITENTAALLKVHASNFRVEGFTASVEVPKLVELGHRRGVLVLHDVGSGCLLPTQRYGLAHEPMPQESVAGGADLVFFSGDKLLGGPQAGIVVGKRELVAKLERHPLARAVRIDKLSLAALTATLLHYLREEAESEIPVWRMISASEESIKDRARRWRERLGQHATIEVKRSRSAVGGGSLPGETLPTWALAAACGEGRQRPEELAARLRQADPPVVARIEDDRVMLDPRTVLLEDEEAMLGALQTALEGK